MSGRSSWMRCQRYEGTGECRRHRPRPPAATSNGWLVNTAISNPMRAPFVSHWIVARGGDGAPLRQPQPSLSSDAGTTAPAAIEPTGLKRHNVPTTLKAAGWRGTIGPIGSPNEPPRCSRLRPPPSGECLVVPATGGVYGCSAQREQGSRPRCFAALGIQHPYREQHLEWEVHRYRPEHDPKQDPSCAASPACRRTDLSPQCHRWSPGVRAGYTTRSRRHRRSGRVRAAIPRSSRGSDLSARPLRPA